MASIYGGASGNGWKLRLDYTVTQDRAANSSSLRLRLYLYANTTGSYNLEKDAGHNLNDSKHGQYILLGLCGGFHFND